MKNIKTFKGTLLYDIIKKLPKVYHKFNTVNIGLFETYGTSEPEERRHKCVLCARNISISDSLSDRGNRLICLYCVYKYFDGDYSVAGNWCRGEY